MVTKRLFVTIVALSLVAASCGGMNSNSVKIAVSVPMAAEYGQDMLHAAQLAVDKAGGKAGKYNVEIVVFSESEPNGETVSTPLVVKNAEEAVKDPSIVGWLGPDSSRTAKEIIPILNRASITHVSGTNTWPGLTKPGYGPGEPGMYYPTGQRNFFRTVSSDEVQGEAAASWIQKLGYNSVFIMYGADVYGSGIAGVFKNAAKDIGLEVRGEDSFNTEGEISPEAIERLVSVTLATQPEVVFLAGSIGSNAEKAALALRQADPKLPIVGPDGLAVDDLILALGPDLANNIYATTVAIPAEELDTPAAKDFVESYESTYGKKPSSFEAAFYEATNALLVAISRAKEPTREAVLDSMQQLGDYTGIFGTWYFDEQGDISLNVISGLQVQNGQWTFVEALK